MGNKELSTLYKIVKVRAEDMPEGYACYFIASGVGMAEEKARMMRYRNPRGEEFPLDKDLEDERYFSDGLKHVLNHEPCGDASCDSFLICYKHDNEKESKRSIERKISDAGGTEENKAMKAFCKIFRFPFLR